MKEDVIINFTLSDILHRAKQGEIIPKVVKPKGMGGWDFNICKHMGLNDKDKEDLVTYRDVMVLFYS